MEDKNIQSKSKLAQGSGINIQPPKQESAQVHAVSPTQVQSGNTIKPPVTTQEKPDFLKHPPKKLDKKGESKLMGAVVIISLIISTCSIVLLLFCINDTTIPQFIQPAIDYLYKIAQNYL